MPASAAPGGKSDDALFRSIHYTAGTGLGGF